MNPVIESMKGKLIVSCQAYMGEPLRHPETMAQMALSWVLRDDVVTSVLVGASRPEQIVENVKVAGQSHRFSDEELHAIDQICEVPLD